MYACFEYRTRVYERGSEYNNNNINTRRLRRRHRFNSSQYARVVCTIFLNYEFPCACCVRLFGPPRSPRARSNGAVLLINTHSVYTTTIILLYYTTQHLVSVVTIGVGRTRIVSVSERSASRKYVFHRARWRDRRQNKKQLFGRCGPLISGFGDLISYEMPGRVGGHVDSRTENVIREVAGGNRLCCPNRLHLDAVAHAP